MLSLYIGGLVFGGILLAAAVLGGHGEADAGGGAHDGGQHDLVPHHRADHGAHAGPVPFFSLRFWAFATAFFGLTGAALTLGGAPTMLVPPVAVLMGLACGTVSARVLGRLGRESIGVVADASAHVGREGRVLLPIGPGRRGKIRLTIGGSSTDLVAETEGVQLLSVGDAALVVGLRDAVALVEVMPTGAKPAGGSQ